MIYLINPIYNFFLKQQFQTPKGFFNFFFGLKLIIYGIEVATIVRVSKTQASTFTHTIITNVLDVI